MEIYLKLGQIFQKFSKIRINFSNLAKNGTDFFKITQNCRKISSLKKIIKQILQKDGKNRKFGKFIWNYDEFWKFTEK